MLAIRLQRLGRKGYPVYRIAVQEAQRHPSSGRVVSYVGNYNPHSKAVTLDKEKIEFYLKNGARPTPRVVKLLKEGKVTLPDWVLDISTKEKKLRNPEKLRKNQPKDESPKEVAEEPTEAAPADEPATEVEETPAKEAPAETESEPTSEQSPPESDEKAEK